MRPPEPAANPVFHVLALGARGHAPAAGPTDPPALPPEIAALAQAEGPVWVDLARHHPEARAVLRSLGVTDELTLDALLMEETRPRAWPDGEALVAFLRGVNLNPDARPEDMVGIRVWMTRDRLVTLRAFRVMAMEASAERVRAGRAEPSTAGLLLDIARGLTERLEETIEHIEEAVLASEARLLDAPEKGSPRGLGVLRRKTAMIRRYVAPQRDLLAALSTSRFAEWFNEEDRERLRELESRQARLVEDMDELRERTQVLYEEAQTAAGERMARTNYLLTLVAALFLPLGFLTGLLGINVGGVPGADKPWAFWVFCALLIALVVAQLWIFRRRRWL